MLLLSIGEEILVNTLASYIYIFEIECVHLTEEHHPVVFNVNIITVLLYIFWKYVQFSIFFS